jgi:hypothetical protein
LNGLTNNATAEQRFCTATATSAGDTVRITPWLRTEERTPPASLPVKNRLLLPPAGIQQPARQAERGSLARFILPP